MWVVYNSAGPVHTFSHYVDAQIECDRLNEQTESGEDYWVVFLRKTS